MSLNIYKRQYAFKLRLTPPGFHIFALSIDDDIIFFNSQNFTL
mgnify:FL=1